MVNFPFVKKGSLTLPFHSKTGPLNISLLMMRSLTCGEIMKTHFTALRDLGGFSPVSDLYSPS